MKLKRVILILILVFISLNIFLIVQDKNGKVDRMYYIKKWTETDQKDMYDRITTDGVIDYMEEQLVYLDERSGMFKEFLVDKGDIVSTGDELYTYEVEHYYEMKSKLDSEVDRLKADVKAIEDSIKKMKKKNIPHTTTRFVYPDNKEAATFKQNTSEAEIMKEQYIIEKEKELEQKKAQLTSVESQVQDLTSGQDVITVESPFSGKVTDISIGLHNPILTIETPDLHINGELTEKERMKVEEGMLVGIELVENELADLEELNGIVSKVSEEPKRVALKGKSIYPFHVTFDEELQLDGLLQGYHANLEITLNESLDAIVVPQKLIDDKKIWSMTHNGKLVQQPIEIGIEMDQYAEVMDGMKKGDRLAIISEKKVNEDAAFITPFTPSKAKWKEIYNNGPRKRSLLIGLLGR